MSNDAPQQSLPVTQLRPFHTHQYLDRSLEASASALDKKKLSDKELLHWRSSQELRSDEETVTAAFVKLVSHIVVLDAGETYCIQDTVRGRTLICSSSCEELGSQNGKDFGVVDCATGEHVPTDFSIGGGKTLQLHYDVKSRVVELAAYADTVPEVALQALGHMLDDIIQILQRDQADADEKWTQPSILNFPPKSRPPNLFPSPAEIPGSLACQSSDAVANEPALLHKWFEQRIAGNENETALDFLTDLESGKRISYTYRQVENAANSLAVELLTAATSNINGSQSSVCKTVAVLIGPCPELYIGYLAVLKAGMAFCPIPVDVPQERRDALIGDLQPCAILVDGSSLFESLSSSTSERPLTVNVAPHLAKCDVQVDRIAISPPPAESDIAYILYTSGTTGMPKGVAVSHISASCTISALSSHYGFISPRSSMPDRPVRWFQGAAPTFDISIFEIFWTLSTGSTLCCAPRDLTLQNISKVVQTLEADITNITPSLASVLDPSSIEGLMLGGEMLNARLLQDFAPYNATNDAIGGRRKPKGIYNGYGPTETAIYCIAQAHIPEAQRGSIIGTPLATCGVLVVEDRAPGLTPVPMGAVGELIITGPQVSQYGYLNRPKEITASFINDARYGRVYRTGDRARIIWDAQQQPIVEFLGRMSDDQVKLSGRRVELGEIDSLLASKVEGIQDVLSVVWKANNSVAGSEKIISLVVPDPTVRNRFGILHARCSEVAHHHLPDYMRPFRILQMDALPKSTSGKTDRKAAAMYARKTLEQDSGAKKSVPTTNGYAGNSQPLSNPKDAKVEEEIINIVSNVLGVECAAATPLVEMGMDSLFAMRILHNIRKELPELTADSNKALPLALQPSLAQILQPDACVRSVFFPASSGSDTKKLDARRKLAEFSKNNMDGTIRRLDLAGAKDIEMILPATTTQSQLAMSFAMDPRSYISHSVLKLKAGTSHEDLKLAVESVVFKQHIFRSIIFTSDDALSPFAQVVLTPAAWTRLNGETPRISRKTGNTTNVEKWLSNAEQRMSIDSLLYNIQIIEPGVANEDTPNDGNGLLIISMAHCICDGASIEALKTDISRRYTGLESIQRDGIYDAVLDWVANVCPVTDKMWQDYLKGWEPESFAALSGNNPHLLDNSTNIRRKHGKAEYESTIGWEDLENGSRALGASPLSVLQAAWSLLLNVFSEADTGDITFGNVTSGSHVSSHAPTFSVVPCRVSLPLQQTLSQLLNCLADHSRMAQRHRHVSFGIFESLPYNTALALQAYGWSDLDHEADSETQAVPWYEVENPAVKYNFAMFAEVLPQGLGALGANGAKSNLAYKLTYREDALSETSAACIVRQLASLVELILHSQPEELVQTLPSQLPKQLLSAEGSITSHNAQALDNRSDLLHHQFEKQALLSPDRLALAFYSSLDAPPTEMTYGELDARANGLAKTLREENVDIIPICMHRSVELYVAILAILKAGSAWCPIDETSPVQRRTSLIARTKSKVLLTSRESLPLVEPCLDQDMLNGVRVLLIDDYEDETARTRPSPRDGTTTGAGLCGKDLAYLLWTSGTTGEPKGVMIQHFAASQAMRDLQVQVEHDKNVEQVRTLQLSSYSFDVFVQDLFYTWGLAGSVISGTRELVLGTFVDFIWTSRPTHAHLTPSFGASIAVDEIKGSSLRYVTFIGEKLTEDVAEAWASPDITMRAYNTYGPAENAVVSTMRRFYGKSRDPAKAANVGFPLNPCTAYVVREVEQLGGTEKRWELVPRYGVGELALGGRQVGKGYLNNETKTTKAFIQGGAGIDERMYLTGDMVRLNDHGFEFLGRNDDLVKITGIRIELSEISAACATIKDHEPAVEHIETFYLPRPGSETENNNKVVVTFVSVKSSDADVDVIRSKIFQQAKDMLPAYMVPGHVVVLDTSMPRTASNKVDRKALQAIYQDSDLNLLAGKGSLDSTRGDKAASGTHWTTSQLAVLQAIAHNFSNAVDNLSPDDSLAGLGLSSLQITKIAWILRKDLQCLVGVIDLMRCQTLGELVDAVVSKLPSHNAQISVTCGNGTGSNGTIREQSGESWVATIKGKLIGRLRSDVPSNEIEHILPATPLQESLIVETMREPRAYWAHRIFDLGHLGEINTDRLKDAWTKTAERFDILRTVFVPLAKLALQGDEQRGNSITWAREQGVQSTIMQLVRVDAAVQWNVLYSDDCTSLAACAEKLQSDLSPSNATAPPWAITFSQPDGKMMLSIHHALYDGVSSEMLLDTVSRLYEGRDPGNANYENQFAFGLELGLIPSRDDRIEALSVWESRLSSVRETAGPLNGPFPDLTQSRQKKSQKIIVSRKHMDSGIYNSSTQHPSQPTLLKSAFGCVLASYLELKAIMFGQTVSQRILHPDLAHVVGPAIATLPVVVDTTISSAENLWKEISLESSRFTRAAHNLHPVDIKRMLNRGTDSSQASFPALFVYHPAPEDSTETCKSGLANIFQETGQALSLNVEHPLALNIFEADGSIELTGDERCISQAQLDLMLDQVLEQARVMLEAPDAPLHTLTNIMKREMLSISGSEKMVGASSIDPTEKVSQHALNYPDRIAVEEIAFKDSETDEEDDIISKTITYAQIDSLANIIASKLALHDARLRTDDVVAMYLERDIKSLAVTLAIFRSGYVYLPIDEDLPLARKQLIIRDSNAKLVITTDELLDELQLDLDGDPPKLLLPDGTKDIEQMMTWPKTQVHRGTGRGGYLLYTSGSTGRPKGVRVSNSNLCHFITAFSSRLAESSPGSSKLGNNGKYLNLTSRAFDPHITQMFVPWHFGHRVVIGKDRSAMIGNLQQIINSLSVTHFGSVPSVLSQLGLRPEDVPSVRVVTTGGEKASNELLDMWSNSSTTEGGGQQHEAVLFNFYGPTEVTIGCLGHPVNSHSNSRNLGQPLDGLEAILLCPGMDGEHVIARRGQPGELCIAGPQVAMGYFERPIENAKSFVTTHLGDGEKRIYKTGDMMRMMHDGTVEFLGRADQQAKIRGQRLELDEVVSFLKQSSAKEGQLEFAAAVVSNGNGSVSQQQLVGFVARNAAVLLSTERDGDVELLREPGQAIKSLLQRLEQECQKGLPAFMVPTLIWASRIPHLVASGKVDTKVLGQLAKDYLSFDTSQLGSPGETIQAAFSEKELAVIAAVEEATGGKVNGSRNSSLQSLGIDSLSAINLVSLLRLQGFNNISIADIVSPTSTVATIAATDQSTPINSVPTAAASRATATLVSNAQLSTADLGPLSEDFKSLKVVAVLPCLPLQSALVARSLVWFNNYDDNDDAVKDGDIPYVTQFRYCLAAGTRLARWKQVAEDVIASEAIFRTCFVQREHDGEIFQVVLESNQTSPFEDSVDSTDIVSQMGTRSPIRLRLGETNSSGETLVTLRVHHALFDGVAIDLLHRKLEDIYNSPLSTSISAEDSLRLLRVLSNGCRLSDADMQSTKIAWQDRLRNVKPCLIDAHSSDSADDSMARSTRRLDYTTAQIKAKLKTNSREAVSLSSVVQLATVICLAKLTHQSSIVYGFVFSLRPLLSRIANGAEDFVGPCLNTLVESTRLQRGTESLHELSQRIQESHNVISSGSMPLISAEKVQRWAGSEDKLFNSLLSINVLPRNSEKNKFHPGKLEAVKHKSKSDMALAIDVDLHDDGSIYLTLSSAGALGEVQLVEVGKLFEKVVWSANDPSIRVENFVQLEYVHARAPNGLSLPSSNGTVTDFGDEDNQNALAIVEKYICRLLRLNETEVSRMPKTTSLYQLGLDSITVLPFINMINISEAIKLNADAVIKSRTIQGVVDLVVRKTKSQLRTPAKNQASNGVPTPNGVIQEATYDKALGNLAQEFMFLATPLQESMLSASLAVSDDAYTYVHKMQLSPGAIEADTSSFGHLHAAFQDTVQACEILRTKFVFTQDDEKPWLGIVSSTEQSDRVNFSIHGDMVQLRIHHSLYDANSIKFIWRVLQDKYQARLLAQSGNDEEAVFYLFRPFARAVALAQMTSIPFWSGLLQGYDYQPAGFVDNSLRASTAFRFKIAEDALSQLQEKCKTQGVSLKAALQLAWLSVLCESIYGTSDIVYGEVVSTAAGFDEESDGTVIGPSINTLPIRAKLDENGSILSISEGLARVQDMNDEMRGDNSMASLRQIQALWRSSSNSQRQATSLFESLFVFDGVIGADEENGSGVGLLKPVKSSVGSDNKDDAPAYDDYPIIVSFHVKNNALYGKLRAKASADIVEQLGAQLESAVRLIVANDIHRPAIHKERMEATQKKISEAFKNRDPSIVSGPHGAIPASMADAVLKVTKVILGNRCDGKTITHDTKLVNIGLDSISAIRLSKALRKQLGINASVFEIIKGSSINEILKSIEPSSKVTAQQPAHQPGGNHTIERRDLIHAVATKLTVPVSHIKSVLPVLAGQRSTLEQWLLNGKRFFEAPWVYRVDESIDQASLNIAWTELCRIHDVLRTTFVWVSGANELVQVTLNDEQSVKKRFIPIQDDSVSIQSLIKQNVSYMTGKPSNLTKPPSSLTYLEARGGKAVVLRVHHALYDAWSIKMIERDLRDLLSFKNIIQPHPSLKTAVKKVWGVRHRNAEELYWRNYLLPSQDTVLGSQFADSAAASFTQKSALGPHFKAKYASIVNHDTVAVLCSQGNSSLSAAFVVAYAKALSHFVNCSRPLFGFNHASRSLSAVDGVDNVDLTDVSVPTLTMTPLCVDLEHQSAETSSLKNTMNAVAEHLAQLNKFSQSDNLHIICRAKFNSYLNVILPQNDAASKECAKEPSSALRRCRLEEPLASNYFTKSEPSQTTMSTIDGFDTSHLCHHRLFFNVVVGEELDMDVAVSGDELLFGDGTQGFDDVVSRFASELRIIAQEMSASARKSLNDN